MKIPIDLILTIVGALIAVAWIKSYFQSTTVYETQRGLHYRKGKLTRVLTAGRYLLFKPWDSITLVDMRSTLCVVTNQEIVCADNLTIKISSALNYRVGDPVKAMHDNRNYIEQLYLAVQLVTRELVAGLTIEEVMAKRNHLSEQMIEKIRAQADVYGLVVESGGIRDITLPGDVKRIFGQVAQAEKAAQASLAKSRAETASLRALANAAKMMEGNPHLMALRTLQSVSELASTSGNTIVLGLPGPLLPLRGNGKSAPPEVELD